MKSLNYLLLLIGIFCSIGAYANSEKTAVYETMKTYANLTACNHSFGTSISGIKTTPKDVFLVNQEIHTDAAPKQTAYYVFWHGDMGCQGSNHSTQYFITKVFKRYTDRFLVSDDHFAFGDEGELISYSHIDSIKQSSHNQFIITAWEYTDIDGYDGVYDQYLYTLKKQYNEYGIWTGWYLAGKTWLARKDDMRFKQ